MIERPEDAWAPEVIERLLHLLETSPELRLRMTIARRSKASMSEVADRWSLDDMAWELAWDMRLLDDQIHRCRTCGIDSREVLQPGGRAVGTAPSWKMTTHLCSFCEEAAEEQAKIENRSHTPGKPRVMFIPNVGGEPFYAPKPEVPEPGLPEASSED